MYRITPSKGLRLFAHENTPAVRRLHRGDFAAFAAKQPHFAPPKFYGRIDIIYTPEFWKSGVRYIPQFRYRVEKGGLYHLNEYTARLLGWVPVEVPWPVDAVELPPPPWLAVEQVADEANNRVVIPTYITTMCRRREVAALTEPFIRYLKDLARGKVG